MTKRRLPRGTDLRYAQAAVEQGRTSKTARALQHLWISKEKRRTHKRERREGRRMIDDSEDL
jgi:hypothetical protein